MLLIMHFAKVNYLWEIKKAYISTLTGQKELILLPESSL